MTTTLLVGDVRTRIRELPDESVHCVVTSPPYFGLRDYGMTAQIGLERTPDAYVAEMVSLFREVRRVLRSDGTLWLNLGDSYAGGGRGGNPPDSPHQKQKTSAGSISVQHRKLDVAGLAAKQRLMIPARVALALQADGWWLRDEIIWHKPNPMPVSVTDRTTPAHEMLYMFAKSARYHYDMEAVKEPASKNSHGGSKANPGAKALKTGNHSGSLGLTPAQRTYKQRGHWRQHAGFNERWDAMERNEQCSGMRQPRSVWTIAPKPFSGAHFATFPPDLIRPCIKAGCPVGGTVLDPFFGAGTTGLVAQEEGRDCIGFELNPEYAAIARERLGLDKPRLVIDLAAVRREMELAPVVAALQDRLRRA